MKKAVIIGATSGIGRELAIELYNRGYAVGMTGRRSNRLEATARDMGQNAFYIEMDVTNTAKSRAALEELIGKMGGMDLIILNAGVGSMRKKLDWKNEQQTIAVNVEGFVNLALHSFNFFEDQKHGHLVGISSMSALFGYGLAPAYTASKAFISNYMQGLRQKAYHSNSNIVVTDIRPGFVETEMTKDNKNMFWVASSVNAAKQIANAINAKKSRAYITKRWNLIAILIKILPNWVLDRL